MDLKEKQIIYVDNKPYIKCGVVMLPTQKSGIAFYDKVLVEKRNSPFDYKEDFVIKPQCLYFTSDEEIKEGDWFIGYYVDSNPIVCQAYSIIAQEDHIQTEKHGAFSSKHAKKIIASTNKSLTINMYDINGAREVDFDIALPQPSQQFIKKFIEEYNKGNIITEVLVEVDCNEINCNCTSR